MRHRAAAFSLIAVAGLLACGGSDNTQPVVTPVSKIVKFSATLSPAQEVPSPSGNSQGTGTFTATLDTSTNVFTYSVSYGGLTSNVTLGHIHGPAQPGVAASVLLNFATTAGGTFNTGVTSGNATGSVVLDAATKFGAINGDSLRSLLLSGQTYANIHTTVNGPGEIRGQILKQ